VRDENWKRVKEIQNIDSKEFSRFRILTAKSSADSEY
jgi:hypothetical protein